MSGQPRRRRTPVNAVVALVLTAAAALAGPVPASGAGPGTGGAATDHGVSVPGTGPTGLPDTEVTLITGDRVLISTAPDGRTAVTVEPAAGAEPQSYRTVRAPDGDVYVYPSAADAGLDSGLLDPDLFNVTELVRQGYDDRGTGEIPLVVHYGARAVAEATGTMPAARTVVTVPRLNFASVRVDKSRAVDFWRSLAPSPVGARSAAGSGIERIWLDRTVTASLDESVPLIGADDAHAAGLDGTGVRVAVLDTGVDPDHPDLADRIIATESFVPDNDVIDRHGHGTHVASTVAGTGAASDGRYAGVAPGADLLIGKVLGDDGNGLQSWAIAGLQWAVDQGADVVNLSFGSSATDGTDPVSQAINQLSATSGTLFVAAAGNSGRFGNDFTVGSPAAADAALAVANFTKTDQREDSSSRGPRVGDHAIKPEIAAPGVNIAAARAAGTTRGTPVDEFYTRLSGTSMAAPHVTGVAALLRQQHPDLTGDQIKDVLTSTAMPVDGYTVYLQGSGRVDAARATTQQVYATGQADFRLMDEEDQVTGRTVTYTNLGDEDVTLSLDLEVTRAGTAAPEGMFTLSADSVTVPAGGTADVSLTLDPALGDVGRYSGFLVGTGAPDVVVTTAVGLEKEPPSANLILNVFDRNGLPPAAATLFVQDTSDPGRYFQRHGAGNTNRAVIRLPIGQYTIYGDIASRDPHGGGLYYASDVFALVEVDVTEEGAEVTLDARTAQDIRMEVVGDDRPLHPMRINQGMYLESANGVPTSFQLGSDPSSIATRHGAIPSGKPTVGKLYHSVYLTQREPLLRARIVEPTSADLFTLPARSGARFDGTRTAPLVFAGAGEPADYEGLDVDGAVVLVSASNGLTQLAETAAAHGAVALLAAQDEPGVLFPTVAAGTELPVLGTTYEEGQRLLDLLAGGPVSVELTGTRESRYGYPLRLNSFEGIPDDLSFTLDPADLTRVVNHFHSDTADRVGQEFLHSFAPWEFITGGQILDLYQPVRRVDYVVPGADMRYQHMVWAGPGTAEVNQLEPIHATYAAGDWVDVHWNRQPYRPSEDGREECNFCRTATQLRFAPSPNGGTHPTQFGGNRASVARTAFRDGVPVANLADLLVPEEATYRIVDRMQRVGSPDITMARQVETEWTFRSQAPDEREIPGCEEVLTGATECAALPVLMPRYRVPLTLLNQAPDDRTYEITVHVDRPIGYRGNDGAVHLDAWVSYDGGETWQSAAVARQDGGGFTVTAGHPPLAATNGFVSLRVEAADGTGNRTRQAITNAYQLSEDACVRTHRADEPIVFGDQDSGVPDRDRVDGCTFQDLIATAGPFGSHGEFVRAVVELSGQWLRDGLLDQRERVAILVAAARSDVGR